LVSVDASADAHGVVSAFVTALLERIRVRLGAWAGKKGEEHHVVSFWEKYSGRAKDFVGEKSKCVAVYSGADAGRTAWQPAGLDFLVDGVTKRIWTETVVQHDSAVMLVFVLGSVRYSSVSRGFLELERPKFERLK